jgi:hypothetical protein
VLGPKTFISDIHVVATYFLALREFHARARWKGDQLPCHQRHQDVPPGSLIEECTGRAVGVDAF